jgi:hypothetical protein
MNHYPDGMTEDQIPGNSNADHLRGTLKERLIDAIGELEMEIVLAISEGLEPESGQARLWREFERITLPNMENEDVEGLINDLEAWKLKHLCIDEPVRIHVVVAKGDPFDAEPGEVG